MIKKIKDLEVSSRRQILEPHIRNCKSCRKIHIIHHQSHLTHISLIYRLISYFNIICIIGASISMWVRIISVPHEVLNGIKVLCFA